MTNATKQTTANRFRSIAISHEPQHRLFDVIVILTIADMASLRFIISTV
jgi:hypothetical protein